MTEITSRLSTALADRGGKGITWHGGGSCVLSHCPLLSSA